MPEMKMIEAEVVDLDAIQFDPDNPRLHSEANLELIQSSIEDVGFARSIVIDESNQLIAGEGATKGSHAAGLKRALIIDAEGDEVIAIRRKNLTQEQKDRLKIIDNRANEMSSWDDRKLAKFLTDHPDEIAAVGFHEDDLKHLLAHIGLKDQDLSQFFADQGSLSGAPEVFKLILSFESQEILDQVTEKLSEAGETAEAGLLALLEL